jgi:hypothetical protein
MKGPPPLRIALNRSPLAAALIAVAYLSSAALLAFLQGPAWLRGAAVVAIGAHALWTLRASALRTANAAIVAVELAPDGRAALIERGGRRREGSVQPASYVGTWLTTLVVRVADERRSRAVAILPDMLPSEDRRRLRIALRVIGSMRR